LQASEEEQAAQHVGAAVLGLQAEVPRRQRGLDEVLHIRVALAGALARQKGVLRCGRGEAGSEPGGHLLESIGTLQDDQVHTSREDCEEQNQAVFFLGLMSVFLLEVGNEVELGAVEQDLAVEVELAKRTSRWSQTSQMERNSHDGEHEAQDKDVDRGLDRHDVLVELPLGEPSVVEEAAVREPQHEAHQVHDIRPDMDPEWPQLERSVHGLECMYCRREFHGAGAKLQPTSLGTWPGSRGSSGSWTALSVGGV